MTLLLRLTAVLVLLMAATPAVARPSGGLRAMVPAPHLSPFRSPLGHQAAGQAPLPGQPASAQQPAKTEPAKAEPAKAEPAKSEPGKAAPAARRPGPATTPEFNPLKRRRMAGRPALAPQGEFAF